MDWTTITVVPLLSAIGGWFGSYMRGYMSEKGKNLATHEDIDKLVDQVRAVTQTTKEIEAKISDQMWDRQRRWELKRDQLMKVVDATTDARLQLTLLGTVLSEVRCNRIPAEAIDKPFDSLNETLGQLEKHVITASLFCSPGVVASLTKHILEIRKTATDLYNGVELDFATTHSDMPLKFFNLVELLIAEFSRPS